MLKTLFRRPKYEREAQDLYVSLVGQARRPEFYTVMAVPDTREGRFELVVLHAFLLMHRLNQDVDRTAELSQCLFDVFFADMDVSLREMGVGDTGIGKRIKHMIQNFYGRIAAYEEGLKSGRDVLKSALERNVYDQGVIPMPSAIDMLEAYVSRERASLLAQNLEDLMQGDVLFGPPV